MAIHLTKKQLHEVLHSDVYESNHGRDGYTRKKCDFAFLLFLEGDEPHQDWSFWEKAIDIAVQSMQPPPAFTHVELFVPPDKKMDEVHFATYLGKEANWGSSFSQSLDFYLGANRNNWRAVPVMALDASHRVRKELPKHVKTPYGDVKRLFNYPFSVPPLRFFSKWIDDAVQAPAHCASLTARCLSRALPELSLPHSSPWFGPSTLFLELTKRSRMESYSQTIEEMDHVRSLPENEEIGSAMGVLLRGNDDAVSTLDTEQCFRAIERLSSRVVDAIVNDDLVMQRMSQHQLAIALLRWSQIQRRKVVLQLEDIAAAKSKAEAEAEVQYDVGVSKDDVAAHVPVSDSGTGAFR